MAILLVTLGFLATINIATVVASDEQSVGSALRMPEHQTGNDVIDESKRSMGLLRLGRSRWRPAEASKRSMGLLRLGRSDSGTASVDDDDKRSMQLLRLGRKRNSDDEDFAAAAPDAVDDQMRRRSMGALRLGRRDEAQKRKMGLLRLGRSEDDDNMKRSMGLLRLG